jgi:hypothetical protein
MGRDTFIYLILLLFRLKMGVFSRCKAHSFWKFNAISSNLFSVQFGDLRGIVRACKERGIVLSFLEQLKFSVQIAAGMAYLSSL